MKSISDGRQVKLGAVFSYVIIIANTLYTLLVTPQILRVLGSAEFGVYKTVASLSASLMVLDLGLGSTLMRYIANYRAKHEENRIEAFISMAMVEAAILALLAGVVSLFFYNSIDSIYQATFTNEEIRLAKKLFTILSINVVVHIFENVFNGIITGYNNFVFGNGIKIARLFLRIFLLYIVFFTTGNVVTLVMIDLCLTVFLALAEYFYIRGRYHIKIKMSIKRCEKSIFKESFIYTALVFVMSFVGQIESNFANVAIGAFSGPDYVTVYSFGLTIFQMFMQLSSAISGVILPTMSNTLSEDNGLMKAERLVVKIGRLQFAILGAVVFAFAIVGKQFIQIWLGDGFSDVYIIALILMFPSLLELCINTCLAILRAKNMLGFKTGVTCVFALVNFAITLIGVKYWSYFSAAIGTAISYTVGSVVIMGFFYKRRFGFNMLKIYAKIFDGIWLCLLIGSAVSAISSRFLTGGLVSFLVNAAAFSFAYVVCLLCFGFSQEEKAHLPAFLR